MFKSLKDFDVESKRVLVRCDFNVPLNDDGTISYDFKIRETLPTIKYLIENKAKIILISHLDNPDGSVTSNLNVIRERLEQLLHISVKKTDDCVGDEVEKQVNKLNPGEVLLLENVRFHKEELYNNADFAKKLSNLGQVYINDAFAVSHRSQASVVGVTMYLPHGAGLLMMKEIENLTKILKNPERPMVTLIGGQNVQTKSKFIDNISELSDLVIISGLIKKEIAEKDLQFKYPEKILGPSDNSDALDISQRDIEMFYQKILNAKTILWNGPFGKFEEERYKRGTLAIANAIIESGAFSVVGGGETVEFLSKEGLLSSFSHVSTGGGAMLQFLSGEKLPGLEVLK